mmetsp:Transcript_21573/g.45795  ORF Transcript_21573/g.45795 Transcript_21573/m.45795 type:complete len:132 (-) Transcript_21573:776-1171(-)
MTSHFQSSWAVTSNTTPFSKNTRISSMTRTTITYPEEEAITNIMLSAKTISAVVAQVVDEAQLEAEFAARLKSQVVLETEIRPTEVIDEEAMRVSSSSDNRKQKRDRPPSYEKMTPEEKSEWNFISRNENE